VTVPARIAANNHARNHPRFPQSPKPHRTSGRAPFFRWSEHQPLGHSKQVCSPQRSVPVLALLCRIRPLPKYGGTRDKTAYAWPCTPATGPCPHRSPTAFAANGLLPSSEARAFGVGVGRAGIEPATLGLKIPALPTLTSEACSGVAPPPPLPPPPPPVIGDFSPLRLGAWRVIRFRLEIDEPRQDGSSRSERSKQSCSPQRSVPVITLLCRIRPLPKYGGTRDKFSVGLTVHSCVGPCPYRPPTAFAANGLQPSSEARAFGVGGTIEESVPVGDN
jgi:hypothetical protein